MLLISSVSPLSGLELLMERDGACVKPPPHRILEAASQDEIQITTDLVLCYKDRAWEVGKTWSGADSCDTQEGC